MCLSLHCVPAALMVEHDPSWGMYWLRNVREQEQGNIRSHRRGDLDNMPIVA